MADAQDAYAAATAAEASQRNLEATCGELETGEREVDPALIVGLAAVAICDRLNELTIRLDYLTHHVLKEPRQL